MPTDPEALTGLTQLGRPVQGPSRALETFPNSRPGRPYTVTLTTEEFTCQCPLTGQPDFATITVEYEPAEKVVESKSLKLYFWSFRDVGIFHEDVVNDILDDLDNALQPRRIQVTGVFRPRGGIGITVKAAAQRP